MNEQRSTTLGEVLNFVTSTQPHQWHHIPSAGDYGEGEHSSYVVNHEHPDLAIMWGLTVNEGLSFDTLNFPNPDIDSFAADILLNGAIVHREVLLTVDGGRAYLPFPHGLYVENASHESELVVDTVSQWSYIFASLLNGLGGSRDRYQEYFDKSKLVAVPGHPLDTHEHTEVVEEIKDKDA
jgi:hypothetical protein